MHVSAWPLANFFLCCLAFRGVLALEILFYTELRESITSILHFLPASLTVPAIFCGIGLLAYLYSFLLHLAKKKSVYDF
jgi:hypothetical protein